MKVIPPAGVIPLSQKLKPVCEVSPRAETEEYVVTRGIVDINPWKEQFSQLTEEFWEDENQVGNVKITRPAHDAWGIKKIVFTFCDDYLQRIYDLPYSRSPEWQPLLDAVYSELQINPNKIVRSLLARMPAGVTIPVHHDTGYWVRNTHRCHLAVETSDDVEFFVGPTEDQMKQVSC
jgi:hypothetical protein